jgi:hypothetical protein
MSECHKCPTAKKIAAGFYKGRPFKKTPCAKCQASECDNHHGRTHVPFDEAIATDEACGNRRIIGGKGFAARIEAPLLERDRAKAKPAEIDQVEKTEHPIFSHAGEDDAPPDRSIDAMAHIAKAFLDLNPTTREIVLDRLAFPFRSLRVVAGRLGLPVSTVHDHLKRARQEWPALAYAIPMKERGAGTAGLLRRD